ncbi:MAG: FAD-binding oxidoreductase [Vampirovibrionales bacterium]|jgi:ferredoxin--NADP+ reductase|nr:FAD-binding oxidoreductase [Vampirovibrionales bacterium]
MSTTQTNPETQDIPSNIYKVKDPLTAKVLKNDVITKEGSPNEVRHIQIDIAGSAYRYLDGQSLGVLPEGTDADGKAHKLRLYSIASPHRGDDGEGKTVSICVKRVLFTAEDGTLVKGVCSNYLGDLKVGDELQVTGPVGKSFLLPSTPNANLIMVATGTGIAPFRAFLQTRYGERVQETGQTHLFFGAQYSSDYLYEEELKDFQAQNESFHLHTAFSREQQNAEGQRLYVQHLLFETRQTIFNLLQDPNTYFFICGLRGMEDGILKSLEQAGQEQGVDWNTLYEQLKAEKRWHIEVY